MSFLKRGIALLKPCCLLKKAFVPHNFGSSHKVEKRLCGHLANILEMR